MADGQNSRLSQVMGECAEAWRERWDAERGRRPEAQHLHCFKIMCTDTVAEKLGNIIGALPTGQWSHHERDEESGEWVSRDG